MGPIRLEVVCASGASLVEEGLDEVVFRRREGGEMPGSLISILPSHGSLLAQTASGEIRWRRGDTERRALAGAGVIEVLDDKVTLLSPDMQRVR